MSETAATGRTAADVSTRIEHDIRHELGAAVRVVICAQPRLFAESLAWCIRQQGDEVLAVVADLPAAREAVARYRPDVLLSDQVPEREDMAAVVLPLDAARAPADGPRTTATTALVRSATLAQVVAQLRCASAGRSPRSTVPARAASAVRAWAPTTSRRLARFLTAREREVIGELVMGSDTATLAHRLRISQATARDHVQSAMTKMGAHSRIEVVSIAVRDGLVDPSTGTWLDAAG